MLSKAFWYSSDELEKTPALMEFISQAEVDQKLDEIISENYTWTEENQEWLGW